MDRGRRRDWLSSCLPVDNRWYLHRGSDSQVWVLTNLVYLYFWDDQDRGVLGGFRRVVSSWQPRLFPSVGLARPALFRAVYKFWLGWPRLTSESSGMTDGARRCSCCVRVRSGPPLASPVEWTTQVW